MLRFPQVIDFKRHGGIFIHTHMYVYFRETNQVTKAGELMEAAASEENVHKVVLFGCASPPCSAAIYLERFYLIKKEMIFLFNILAVQKLYFCTVIIQYIPTLILQWRRVTILNQTAQFREFAQLRIS